MGNLPPALVLRWTQRVTIPRRLRDAGSTSSHSPPHRSKRSAHDRHCSIARRARDRATIGHSRRERLRRGCLRQAGVGLRPVLRSDAAARARSSRPADEHAAERARARSRRRHRHQPVAVSERHARSPASTSPSRCSRKRASASRARWLRNIRLLQMDAADLKFADDSFDIVYAPYLISVVPDPVQGRVRDAARLPAGRADHLPEPFSQPEPAGVSRVERLISPFTIHIGFKADLDLPAFLAQAELQPVVDRESEHPADLVARHVREGLSRPLWLAVVLAAFCVPLFVGLGARDLENDEAIYSFAVDSILASGDWLNPVLSPFETDRFLEKPPLKFWIVAAPIALGLLPHNELGLRSWDAAVRRDRLPLRLCARPPARRRRVRAVGVFVAVRLLAAAVRARPARQRHGSAAVPQLLRRHLSLPRLGGRPSRQTETRGGATRRR